MVANHVAVNHSVHPPATMRVTIASEVAPEVEVSVVAVAVGAVRRILEVLTTIRLVTVVAVVSIDDRQAPVDPVDDQRVHR